MTKKPFKPVSIEHLIALIPLLIFLILPDWELLTISICIICLFALHYGHLIMLVR